MLFYWLMQYVVHPYISVGPHGFYVWIEPPHIAAGFGIVRDHFVAWFETGPR